MLRKQMGAVKRTHLLTSCGAFANHVRGVLASAAQAPHGSWFQHVEEAPKDPILGVTEKFLADNNPNKINLGVGAYRDDRGQPLVLRVVREAEAAIAGTNEMEYLPISGHREFVQQAVRLAYGDQTSCLTEGRVAAVQSLSGTGACRLFAELVNRYLPGSQVLIPDPTWSNHHNIFRDAHVPRQLYRYYNAETRGLDFEGLMEDLQSAPEGSVVLLHACAHNPTGVDPSLDQWKEMSRLMMRRHLFPFFDMAYQGFASGDCQRDAAPVHMFLEDGHLMGLSQSFAKNMGLYGQRVGALSVVCASASEARAVESQMKAVARPMYSNPPLHGALLVATILSTPLLKEHWYQEVADMAKRIIDMRRLLRGALEGLGSPLPWSHITQQIGMFCYSGLTPEQVDRLMQEHSIYMTRNGRISMAGVTSGNVQRLAEAIHAVTTA